ncbi:MAG: PHP domain-containing protein [Clostridia bacterium]|nr:PHP domain-containing protein [Clostridia bacterium]
MNTKYADLHLHTTCSDGSMTPTELVRHACEAGLSVIAVTDHDCVDGVEEAVLEGKRLGITVIPGIEISVASATETHILGYGIDIHSKLLSDRLRDIKEVRCERNRDMCQKLCDLGFEITLDEVKKNATGDLFGSTHFAATLLKKGYVSSMKEAFDKYLAAGRPAHAQAQCLSPEEGIELIKRAGGGAFLAHPHLIRVDDSTLRSFIVRLRDAGLDGIEGYYTDYTPEMEEKFRGMAEEFGLMISGGTDFHGSMKPHISIGRGLGNMRIPCSVADAITNKFEKIYL